MIIYKPLNKIFRNRLELKVAIGHGNLNRLIRNSSDDLIYTNNEDLLANYEYFYSNPIKPNKPNIKK